MAMSSAKRASHRSTKLGKGILAVEVTNVSKHGFWLLISEVEQFVPFDQFPWFREASIGQITNVELPNSHHLYWPELDLDLNVESISHPERFSLVSSTNGNKSAGQKRRRTNAKRSAKISSQKAGGK